MRKKQIFLYLGIFFTAVLAMLGIAFGIRQAIRAGNLAGIDWYNTYDKEFVIKTEEELYDLATLSNYYDFAGQTIKLGADIVVNEGSAEDWKEHAPSKKWQPITEFAGTFDGQGHSISGLYGKSSSMSMGLFSETKKGCVIKDFKLLNSFFSNSTNNGVGSIMGEGTGKIQKVYSDAIIYGEGESNGGIAGLIKEKLTLKECWFDGKVIGEQRSNGGMIGWVDRKADVKIDNCLNSGLIQFIGEGNSKTGGFIGGISDIAYRTDVSQVTISNSLSTGKIDVTNTTMAGAAVGTVRQIGALTFDNTYAVVEVTDNAATETTIGSVNGKLTGNAVPRYRETLIGVGGYQWTNLDFDKYWSCVEGDTPILKCFADKELSLAGVEKKVDTSWYVEGQTEFVLMDAPDLWGFAMLSANTNFEGVTIKLGADITINDSDSKTWKEKVPEYNWFPIYSFSGTFDGQKHTISGLYVYSNGKRMSFFQQVNANGTIANFKLVNSYVRGSYCIGAVVAQGGGNISNVYTDAVVENTGEHTGGIIGALNQNGTISNCWFDGEVHGGTSYTGGITSASLTPMGVITHCLNTGDVYGGTKHSTGGIIGIVNGGVTISDTMNAGKVDDSLSSNKNRTGSIIGRIFDSTETTQVTAHISSTYATRESYETSIGQGYQNTGAPAVNTLAELTGNEGYRRTQLNFDKYWAIDADSHPTLQTFAEEIPTLPENVKRPIVADINWFDFDEDVFVINTAEEFYGLTQLIGKNDFEGKTIKLGKDITFNTGNSASWSKSAPLNQWASLHGFNGTFDGQGHTISGLYIRDGLWRVGLFGTVPEKAVIKNVKVTNSYFEGAYHIGAVAGYVTDATVQGVYSDANIVARKGHGGGLVGTLVNAKMDNAWFAGTLSGECDYIGGITSFISLSDSEQNRGTTLSNCLNTGTITGKSNVGGLVGRVAAKATIKYSLNAGTVTGVKNFGSIVGAVVKDDKTSLNVAEGVYATKESSKKTVGTGTARGTIITNTAQELTGVGGYQRTILDFNKYWSIVETGTPVLKKYGGTPVAIPNVARATAPDTSWYNAKKDVFVLTDYADLYGLAVLSGTNDFKGKTIKLGADIVANAGNAEDFKDNAPLNQLTSVFGFAGTFDGQGHTVSGLASNSDSAWYVGIIGTTVDGAVVKNVNVENSYIKGEYHIGSVVGYGTGVTIENIYTNALMDTVAGHLGGIVGTVDGDSSISNCWFDGSVIATDGSYVGGITSFVAEGKTTITHCLNTAPIKAKTNAAGIVGRVAGELTLKDSLTTGLINCMSAAGTVVGHIIEGGKATFDAVYGLTGTKVVGKGSNYSGDAQIMNGLYMTGTSGYVYSGLDYGKYWTALDGKTPELSYFSDKITGEKVSLKGVERKDTSWYDADKKTYVLKDRADLFGFTYLLNSGNTFKGKTITIGEDIEVNDGDAADWAEGSEPLYQWMPIGSYVGHTSYTKAFAGTFNGKMHSISGLYTKQTGKASDMGIWCAGLFGRTGEGTVVKNVEVLNSYFESPYYGGVVGHATGTTIDTIYTDAIVVATGGNTGGIVGSATESNINNVWFAGSVENAGQFTGGIVGVTNDGVTISNALTTGKLTSTTASNNVYIGGIVGGANGTTLVTDSISVPESITATKKNCIGSVIGGVNKSTKATATNTYALESTSNLTIGQQVKAEEVGAATNRIKVCADLNGLNGYSLTKLDFANYWVALAKKSPELMSFSEGTALALDTSFRADTAWYTDAVADGQGNEPGTEENPYVIYNKTELYGFAELVNGGTTFKGQYVQLGADISVNAGGVANWSDEAPDYTWVPIGSYVGHTDYSKSFAGTFDGMDEDTGVIYSISGLYTKKTGATNNMSSWCAGLFGRTAEGATVKNIRVERSYFEGSTNNGVIGHATGTTIENVYSDATVVTTGTQNGGIVGAMVGGTIDSAWFDGKIQSKDQFVGGIVGLANADAVITNCLTTGEVTSTRTGNAYAGGLVGCASGDITLTNSISAAKTFTTKGNRAGAVFGSANDKDITVTMDDVYAVAGIHKFAVGENSADDKEKNGTYTGNYTEHPWVMPTLDGFNGYTLTKLDFEDKWIAVDGKTPELKALTAKNGLNTADSFRPDTEFAGSGTETDPYVISTKEELYGLAQLVNDGTTFDGQFISLGADITVNALAEGESASDWEAEAPAYAWTPIGYYNVRTKISANFKGTFSGANPITGEIHKISGLYMSATKDDVNIGGLFVDTAACTIKNLRLEDSYIEASEGTAAIAGWKNGGTFDTIYTNAIVKSHKNYASGIVGLIDEANSKITNCWFDGELTGAKYVGGIVAYVYATDENKQEIKDLEISHCLNTGTVESTHVADANGTRTYAGGIIGDANTTVTITDCLVACKEPIQTTENMSYMGTIAGRYGTGSTISNVYALSDVCGKTANDGNPAVITKVADIDGKNGYMLTELDFINYWVMKLDAAPQLQSFVASDDANAVNVRAWYDDATEKEVDGQVYEPGTEKNPYIISEDYELYSLAKIVNSGEHDFADQYIVLDKDITFNTLAEGESIDDWEETPPTYAWTPIGYPTANQNYERAFKGCFDGGEHTITGLYICGNSKSGHGGAYWYLGLFGMTENATIQNINLTDCYIAGGAHLGAIVADAKNTDIENVSVEAKILTKHGKESNQGQVGGIVSSIYGGSITNAEFNGTISTKTLGNTGGIAGVVQDAKVNLSGCHVVGTIESTGNSIGGLVGRTYFETDIKESWYAGTLTGAQYVGGLVGNNGAVLNLTDCLNTGIINSTITADPHAYQGGLVGRVYANVTVRRCLEAGTCGTGAGYKGSAFGRVESGKTLNVTDCYFVKQQSIHVIGAVSGTAQVGGSVLTENKNNPANVITDKNTILGAGAYSNMTGLIFDRPETDAQVEGPWVITQSTPVLKRFSDKWAEQMTDAELLSAMKGQFVADIRWANAPVVENIDGVDTNTYTIDRPEELIGLASLVNAGTRNFAGEKIYLKSDLVFNTLAEGESIGNWENTPPTYAWTPIGYPTANQNYERAFKGCFDGGEHTITGLYICGNSKSGHGGAYWYLGLFGMTENATIQNINLTDCYIAGGAHLGAIVADAKNTDIENVSVEAKILTKHGKESNQGQVGGIVSSIYGGSITNAEFNGTISTKTLGNTGGIAGVVQDAKVNLSGCHVVGTIESTGNSIGGLVGRTYFETDIKESWYAGTLTGAQYVGGLVGNNGAVLNLTDCLNTGTINSTITASPYAHQGGLVGRVNANVTATRCLEAGTCGTGAGYKGSAFGRVESGKTLNVTDCYFVKQQSIHIIGAVSGTAQVGGSVLTDNKNNPANAITDKNTILGAGAYSEMTGLEFDIPETDGQVEGPWVIRTGDVPVLKQFVK